MNPLSRSLRSCSFFMLLVFVGPASAGSQAADGPVLDPLEIVRLAKKVERAAAELGARVFLLARVGRPRSELPEGVDFTHVAFGVYSQIRTSDGRDIPGYALYNLYQRKDLPSRSHLAVDFPVDFLAGAHEPRAGIIIPDPALQQRLLEVLASGRHAQVHNPAYSAFSNPYSSRYQNCTEYVLDVLNAAIYGTTDPQRLKANARAHFEAQEIRINPLKLFFASLFMPEIRLSDHRGPIRTATFEGIARYLQSNDLVQLVTTISL
jgi:hypothetical protein